MITATEALQIATQYLERSAKEGSKWGATYELTITKTLERPFGWVFCYDSKAYLETGDMRHAIAGNAPIIVDRKDGSVHVTGTGRLLAEYLDNYEKTGSPHGRTANG
jgi:hypothetical protein